jgi:hypothetical protein
MSKTDPKAAAFQAAKRSAREAVRRAALPQRPPTEADRRHGQPVQLPKVLPGQTDIFEAIDAVEKEAS